MTKSDASSRSAASSPGGTNPRKRTVGEGKLVCQSPDPIEIRLGREASHDDELGVVDLLHRPHQNVDTLPGVELANVVHPFAARRLGPGRHGLRYPASGGRDQGRR